MELPFNIKVSELSKLDDISLMFMKEGVPVSLLSERVKKVAQDADERVGDIMRDSTDTFHTRFTEEWKANVSSLKKEMMKDLMKQQKVEKEAMKKEFEDMKKEFEEMLKEKHRRWKDTTTSFVASWADDMKVSLLNILNRPDTE